MTDRRRLIPALILGASAALAAPASAQSPSPPAPPPQDPATQPEPAPTPQRVVISGVPSKCVRSSFVVRVSIQPPSPPTGTRGSSSTRVTLDFKRVLRVAARTTLSVRVPAARLRPGRHRIGVSVTSRVGNLEELRAAKRFRRCR